MTTELPETIAIPLAFSKLGERELWGFHMQWINSNDLPGVELHSGAGLGSGLIGFRFERDGKPVYYSANAVELFRSLVKHFVLG